MKARNLIRARRGARRGVLLSLLLLPCCCASPALASSASTAGAAPTPSNYAVGRLCATPTAGHSGCLGLRLVPREPLSVPGARSLSHTSRSPSRPRAEAIGFLKPIKGSFSPANVLGAYGLAGLSPPSTQTIAVVDAYDDPTIEADLEVFDSQFGLPACTEANGCFRKVDQVGNAAPLPASGGTEERGWAQEIAADVEVAHGVCQSCRILLVEAESNEDSDLYAAEQTAAALGATEISNSWGGEEPESGSAAEIDNATFNHPGIVITASSGDNGYLNWLSALLSPTSNYPASSPHVVAVGGTRLELNEQATAWESERVWNDGGEPKGLVEALGAGGGGCSESFSAPSWQLNVIDWSFVGCGSSRAVADVSADADPYTGVAVYDSTELEGEAGWFQIGGTSVASPIIAAAFALAGGAQGVEYPARTLYENEQSSRTSLHDVRSGSNGECLRPVNGKGESNCPAVEEAESCEVQAICLAVHGYDGPTGVGTPDGIGAFRATGVGGERPTATAPAEAQPVTGVSAPGAKRSPTPIVSALRLTHRAIVALNRRRPHVSRVAFAFTLNISTRVRVTIAKRVRVHGHVRWRVVAKPLTMLAGSGRQTARLRGRRALAPGRYRLTVTPLPGTPASIVFHIG